MRVLACAVVVSAAELIVISLRELPPAWALFVAVLTLALSMAALAARRDALRHGPFRARALFGPGRAWLGSALLSLIMMLVLAWQFEVVFYIANLGRDHTPMEQFGGATRIGACPTPHYGYVQLEGIYPSSYAPSETRQGFDVINTIGPEGFRVTPQENMARRKKHLLFFGCSFTFGTGCEDDETIAAKVARIVPDYHTYNFGTMGYGPGQTIAMLQDDRARDVVREPEGLAIYTFIGDHFRRVTGTMRRRTTWAARFPVINIAPDGNASIVGNFEEVQPWRSAFYRLLSHEQFFQWGDLDWPLSFSDADVTYMADILAAARREYCTRIGGRDLYVLMHPTGGHIPQIDTLIDELKKRGVPVLDYRRMFDGKSKDFYILSDMHPTPLCNKFIAEQLMKDLPLLEVPGKRGPRTLK